MSWFDLSRWQLESPEVLWALAALPLLWLLRERSPAGLTPWRSFGAMVGRALAYALLVLALAGPYDETESPDRSAVFVLDASASLDGPRSEAARSWLEAAWAERGEAPARIVVAGQELAVVDDLDDALELLERPAPDTAGTDLRSALELGLASLPPARHREVVLLSDGSATRGRLDEAVRVASARDLPIHAVPLGPGALRAAVTVVTPEQDKLFGDEVGVDVTLTANAPVQGEVGLYVGASASPVAREQVAFGPGDRAVRLTFTPESHGLHEVRVALTVDGDVPTADDVSRARLRVQPRPSALVVGAGGQARALRQAVAGYRPELVVDARAKLPDPPYDDHSLIVLLDPELRALGSKKTDGLIEAVADGGRLLITGGANGLVTDEPEVEPLADILPVRFPKTKKKQRAPLSVVYCLDSSDSMAGSAKFELAAAALAQSLYLLPEESRVGVISFADFAEWVVPLGPFEGSDEVIEDLVEVRVRGGTSIYHCLQEAYDTLKEDDALVKHAILLSDGQSTTTFSRNGDVVISMLRKQITVSTIAVSSDSDRPEMERIAEAGGGRSYYAARFGDLPQLFLDEMMMVTRTNKVEEEFVVHPVLGSRWLERVPDEVDWPKLKGYVRGEQRPGSELALATSDGHPVLVAGRHGRGTVTMFTSDVGGEWSKDWATWEHHAPLWESVLEALLRPEPPERLALTTEVEGHRAHLTFDAVDLLLNPRGDLVVEAIVEPPTGPAYAIDLPPIGPGRYGGGADLEPGGATLVRVAAVGTTRGRAGSAAPGGELLASVEPTVADEVRAASFNPLALRQVVEQTGGAWDPSPEQLYAAEVPRKLVRHDRHPPLLWAALALLLIDLGWRRLRVPGR
jgi:Ca-activated chloride channel homolog